MQIFRTVENIPVALKKGVFAIGNFDGVHLGHRAVIGVARGLADELGTGCGALTFEPHPRQFFSPDKRLFRLSDEKTKLGLLKKLGIDAAVVLKFDQDLAGLKAETFVREILVNGLEVVHVVAGFDFFFGRGREGNPELLRVFGEKYGFGVTIVEAKSDGDSVYSSSNIREFLKCGDVEAAAAMLGYRWCVAGAVEPGDQRGRVLGFPTVNLSLDNGLKLKWGIYAVRVSLGNKLYNGAAYLGRRPTFEAASDAPVKLEAHLFDFDGDLYGEEISVEFVKYLREDRVFGSSEELAAQMQLDCEAARTVLENLDAVPSVPAST